MPIGIALIAVGALALSGEIELRTYTLLDSEADSYARALVFIVAGLVALAYVPRRAGDRSDEIDI